MIPLDCPWSLVLNILLNILSFNYNPICAILNWWAPLSLHAHAWMHPFISCVQVFCLLTIFMWITKLTDDNLCFLFFFWENRTMETIHMKYQGLLYYKKKSIVNGICPFFNLVHLSDDKFVIFFLFFPGNRIWHFMQIGDNLHEMLNPVSQKKIRKVFQMSFAENFT